MTPKPPPPAVWLVDYDLTLYGPEERSILDHLDVNITTFVQHSTGLPRAEADALRKEFCRIHGTTLAGMRAAYGTDPDAYFDAIHNGPGPLPLPASAPSRRAALQELRKQGSQLWVFTNGRRDWAERGIAAMGIADLFEGIFDLQFSGWTGKPAAVFYHRVEQALGLSGAQLAMIDDRPENLLPGHEKGWRTVLCGDAEGAPWAQRVERIEHLVELA